LAKILVIDDESRVRRAMRFTLEGAGHEVIEASDGDKGLEALETEAPDLIICDLLMPEREGVSTIVEIRQRGIEAPIIAVSGGGQTGRANFLESARNLGADSTMDKPVGSSQLLAEIDRLLELFQDPD
jgi:CheY-like chemotaxis protein